MQPERKGADASQWDAYVQQHPKATFFHLFGWQSIIRDTFRHRFHQLTVREGGAVSGILPLAEIRSRLFGHALIANGFCVGGGPLYSSGTDLCLLAAQAEDLGRRLGVDYIEFRDTSGSLPGWTEQRDLYAGFDKVISPDEADNLKQIPKKQRAVVRKSMTMDFSVTIDRTIDPFFSLYARNVRDHGTPALPRRFFANLLSTFGANCEILTVHRAGLPISSVLSYFFRDRVMPYYTGSAPEARATGANDFMYWSLMRRAAARGLKIFDFGRSKVGTGPYRFKHNWGFEPHPITHQYRLLNRDSLPNINPTNPRYAFFIRAWQQLPLPVANAIAPFLSRNLA